MNETPDVLAPPPHHRRFPLLDGMRAIAVLSVVGVHVAFFAVPGTVPVPRLLMHLNVGVTIFFLISGFLLYRPFIAHRCGGAAMPATLQYLKRRALRIFPAYWLALSVLTVFPGAVGVSDGGWLSQYSLTHTLPLSGSAGGCAATIDCGLAQTWSLVVELTFYAVLPLWFLLSERLARAGRSAHWARNELVVLLVLSAVSVTLHFGTGEHPLRSVLGGTVAGFVPWFALGMALAIGSVAVEGGESKPRAVALLARYPELVWAGAIAVYVAMALVLPATPFLFDRGQQAWTHLAFGLVALLLMLPAVFADDAGGLPRRLLANPALAWLGLISYGIFLWHYVVALEFGSLGDGLTFWPLLGATLGISVAAAAISYYALERPVLRFKYSRSNRPVSS